MKRKQKNISIFSVAFGLLAAATISGCQSGSSDNNGGGAANNQVGRESCKELQLTDFDKIRELNGEKVQEVGFALANLAAEKSCNIIDLAQTLDRSFSVSCRAACTISDKN